MNPTNTISPLDGRYSEQLADLRDELSEQNIIMLMVGVELDYVFWLCNELDWTIDTMPETAALLWTNTLAHFGDNETRHIRALEHKTKHIVKAVELWLADKFEQHGMEYLVPYIHMGLTSEDVMGTAYARAIKDTKDNVLLSDLVAMTQQLIGLSVRNLKGSMLGWTHGQPATPTTFGKEMAVYVDRLSKQLVKLRNAEIAIKFSGATGTYSAQHCMNAETDWIDLHRRFVQRYGLSIDECATQVGGEDTISAMLLIVKQINVILLDLVVDLWLYQHNGTVDLVKIDGAIGSSTMPHKINPIKFENAEGNLQVANALIDVITSTLPRSRMQRDLSGGTIKRNIPVALGHSLLAWRNIQSGLGQVAFNEERSTTMLNNNHQVLSEAIQMTLRLDGKQNAYDTVYDKTHGAIMDASEWTALLGRLDVKSNLKPDEYTGKAAEIAERTLEEAMSRIMALPQTKTDKYDTVKRR